MMIHSDLWLPKTPDSPSPFGSHTHSESTTPPCHYHFPLLSRSPTICSATLNTAGDREADHGDEMRVREREQALVLKK